MRTTPTTQPGRRSRRLLLGALVAIGILAMASCQAGPGAPSNLQPGYKYYDFALKNQTIQDWESGATQVVVHTDIANAGQMVYVQLFCSGNLFDTASTYVYKDSNNFSASGTINNIGASSVANCTFREHVPDSWAVPTIVAGATHTGGGAVISVGAVISNY